MSTEYVSEMPYAGQIIKTWPAPTRDGKSFIMVWRKVSKRLWTECKDHHCSCLGNGHDVPHEDFEQHIEVANAPKTS